MLQDIKKLEYRVTPAGAEVIDILYTDKTKVKLPVAKITEELASIDSQIDALRRTRRQWVKMQELIDANRVTPENTQVLDASTIT
jgi:endonuclease V-like protein UPF0215 family